MKKPKDGWVSKDQRVMMARLVNAGAICVVANGLTQATAQLDAWQLLKPMQEGRRREFNAARIEPDGGLDEKVRFEAW
ncbi:hypothetical protein ABIC08_007737 [Bradyrhizobium sp. RT9b]|uniref:hypothetical protein n=1 Tax=unclassified Bradyrhizobium TaxID=2631580 RepID=UPI003397FAB7